MLSECFPPRLRLPLCLQEDQRRPNPGIRGWMHAEGRAQLCAVGAQCCRGRLPEQQIPAELDVLVWFFFPPAAQDPIAKHKAMVGNGTISESWDQSTGPILGVISSMDHHPVTAVGCHSMQCKERGAKPAQPTENSQPGRWLEAAWHHVWLQQSQAQQ